MYWYFGYFVVAMIAAHLTILSLHQIFRRPKASVKRPMVVMFPFVCGVFTLVVMTWKVIAGLKGEYADAVRDVFLPIQIYGIVIYLAIGLFYVILSANRAEKAAGKKEDCSTTPKTDRILENHDQDFSPDDKLEAIEEVIGVHPTPFDDHVGPSLVKRIVQA